MSKKKQKKSTEKTNRQDKAQKKEIQIHQTDIKYQKWSLILEHKLFAFGSLLRQSDLIGSLAVALYPPFHIKSLIRFRYVSY
jgi:hypothetical protein